MKHIQAQENALLNLITNVEQTLATGTSTSGQAVKPSSLTDQLIDAMLMGDDNFKLRLLLIFAAQVPFSPLLFTTVP